MKFGRVELEGETTMSRLTDSPLASHWLVLSSREKHFPTLTTLSKSAELNIFYE